jgi:hypothetical protein
MVFYQFATVFSIISHVHAWSNQSMAKSHRRCLEKLIDLRINGRIVAYKN